MPMKVGVLKGGPSEERDVSLSSGKAVAEACRANGFDTTEFPFHFDHRKLLHILKKQDIVFNALHGGIGENGKIQAWMNENGIPNTGSGPESSALCMDKEKSKSIATRNNIPTPKWEMLLSTDERSTLPIPFVVKPNDQGSTVGLTIVHNESEIVPAIIEAFAHGDLVMVEEYIHGRELTVTVLGDKAYPIVEIRPSHELYDYECKYTPGMSQYICPAEIPEKLTKSIQHDTELIFKALGCDVYARADYLLDENGQYYFLEMNTLPGMTSTSLVPKSVKATGMSFDELIKKIIELSL
jgi:D-alanine-D-alanine ligase